MIHFHIKELRQKRKMSQQYLAVATNITRQYLSALEHGRKMPSFMLLNKLAAALEVSITELLNDQAIAPMAPEVTKRSRRR